MTLTDDPTIVHMMPLVAGPFKTEGGILYRERQVVALQYETDPECLAALLPECYEPGDKPIVTASFVYNHGLDFMGGRGYRIGTIGLSARFNGERDNVDGSYFVVMYEDDTLPIVLGRELLGVPKVYGDISAPRVMPSGMIRCEVSVWGHLLFGIDVDPNVKQPDSIIETMNTRPRGPPMLGYKYIHGLDGPPDAAYPIATPSDATVTDVWTGDHGRIYYGDPGKDDVGLHRPILKAVKTLTVTKVLGVSRTFGSSLLRGDLAKRLR